jgi:phosphoribosyl 1,2-cyclic phosphate phosphodiesterase
MHGQLPILGFRIGNLAYITDMKSIDDGEYEYLKGVETLVVNALRHKEHRTHQTVEDAIAFSRRIGAKNTYFIHMSHDVGLHATEESKLPEGFHYAYDGLEVECC